MDADLKSLTPDSDLLSDARAVLESQAPTQREVQNQSGAWFTRRSARVNVDDGLGEGLRRFLWQVVANSPIDGPMLVLS